MKPRRVPSADTEGVLSVEEREYSQMRYSSLLQAANVVCKLSVYVEDPHPSYRQYFRVARREIELCAQAAQNEKRLWGRKDVRAFSQSMKMRTKTNDVISVKYTDWQHIPTTYLHPHIHSFGREQGGCGDEGWLRTPGGSTFTAVRPDGTRSVVAFVPSSTNNCLRQRVTKGLTEEYMTVEDLQKVIMNHLETGNNYLQIFTTPTTSCRRPSRETVSTTSCGNQTSVKSDNCGSQTTLNTNTCGSQVTVNTNSCGSQAVVDTNSCGCCITVSTSSRGSQTAVGSCSTGTQASPSTSDVECEIAPARVDVSCQTDPIQTSDAQTGTAVTVEDIMNTAVQTQDFTSVPLTSRRDVEYNHQSLHATLKSSECTELLATVENDKPSASFLENQPSVSPLSLTIEVEEDVEEFDDFHASHSDRLKAMTEELNNRCSQRNELSLADELAGALQGTSIKNDNRLPHMGTTEYSGHEDQYPLGLSDEILSLPYLCTSPSSRLDLSLSIELNVPRNSISLADELSMAITCTNRKDSVLVPNTSSIKASYSHSADAPAVTSSIDINVEHFPEHHCSNTITDDVMLRVFGFNPQKSPFVVNGYPVLPSMPQTLDDIDLPILDKKEVEFLRTDDGMFISVGHGSYGCVYLANMAGHSGQVVVKDYINEFVVFEVIQHEARLLKYLSDTGFVPEFLGLIKSSASNAGYSLIQEYFGQGLTIYKLLTGKTTVSKTSWMRICCQLSDGLEAIHTKHVLFNDIKSDNVLVDLASGVPKVGYIDVGMATYRHGLRFEQALPHIDMYKHIAPEVCMGSHSSPLSDIYSLGYLLEQIGRKSQIQELMILSQACKNPLPIERMSLKELKSKLTELQKVVEQEETADVNRILENSDGGSSCGGSS